MRDYPSNSVIFDYFLQNNKSSINIDAELVKSKSTNENSEPKELDKKAFQIIQQGGSLKKVNQSISLNRTTGENSYQLPGFIDDSQKITENKNNVNRFDGDKVNSEERKEIHINLNDKEKNYLNMMESNINYEGNYFKGKIANKNNIASNDNFTTNNEISNPYLNYKMGNIFSKNYIHKKTYSLMVNNNNNNKINLNNNINNNNNNVNNSPLQNYYFYNNPANYSLNNNTNINNNIYITTNYYLNQNPQSFYIFPENAFTYNYNSFQRNNFQPYFLNNNYNNQIWKTNRSSDNKRKDKIKLEHDLFVINLDNIIQGKDKRTTVMVRHIPNKYTSEILLEEIDVVCKNKYDFFYLPIDNVNNCNLGYAFINFVNPLHIINFYQKFKSRKWKFYKSHKECDLTFAKFQGKSELTANLEKNMNKINDKKRLPIIFQIEDVVKIDLDKMYYDEIKKYRPELVGEINWI